MLPGRYRPVYRLVLFAADLFAVNTAFLFSYLLWIVFYKNAGFTMDPMYLQLLFYANLIWFPVFFRMGLYSVRNVSGFARQARTVVAGVTLGIMLLTFLIFFVRFFPTSDVSYSRAVFIIFWLMGIVLMIAGRGAVHAAVVALKSRDRLVVRTLIMGNGEEVDRMAAAVRSATRRDLRPIGAITTGGGPAALTLTPLGGPADLERVVKENHIEAVIVADSSMPQDETLRLLTRCREIGVAFHIRQDYLGVLKTRTSITDIAGSPTVTVRDTPIRGFNQSLKRFFDVTGAVALLMGLSPLLFVTAALIRLDSRGPIFFRQSRVGRNGKHFEIFKFRSMFRDADARKRELECEGKADGHLFKICDDPRITRVGRFIRQWSIDELPQFLNVLFGEMSLVGPRPLVADEAHGFEAWHERRLEITPGVTGLWQVSGRSDLNFEDMVKLDLYYIENWSLWLDLEILFRTVPAVFLRRGAM